MIKGIRCLNVNPNYLVRLCFHFNIMSKLPFWVLVAFQVTKKATNTRSREYWRHLQYANKKVKDKQSSFFKISRLFFVFFKVNMSGSVWQTRNLRCLLGKVEDPIGDTSDTRMKST